MRVITARQIEPKQKIWSMGKARNVEWVDKNGNGVIVEGYHYGNWWLELLRPDDTVYVSEG